MSIKVGTFDGCVKDWGLYKEDQVFMKFDVMFDEQEEMREMVWFGSLKGLQEGKQKSAREISLETMFKAGWTGDIDEFVKGKDGKAFNFDKVIIKVIPDDYPGHEGKFKIGYINRPGEGGGLTGIDPTVAKSVLTSIKGDIMAAKEAERVARLPKPEGPKLATAASVAKKAAENAAAPAEAKPKGKSKLSQV